MRKVFLGLLLLIVAVMPALATEDLRLSGFGTLGYAVDSRSDIFANRDISQSPTDGYQTGASWRTDTRIGVQLEYKPVPLLELVGQVVLRDHYKADLNSSTELAYAVFRPDVDMDFRVGRVNYDAFLMSDHRNVGYAYPWVRPSAEFYGWIPIFSLNGLDAAYQFRTEGSLWRVKAQAGSSRFWVPVGAGAGGGYQFSTDNVRSLSVSHQSGNWRLKAAHSRFTIATEIPLFGPLHAGLHQVAAAGIPGISDEAGDLKNQMSFNGARISYTTLGAVYDDATWLLQAELGHSTSTAEIVPHSRMVFAAVARRLGDWTTFLSVSTSRPVNGVRTATFDWGPSLNSSLRNRAVFLVNGMRIDQDTVSVGTRWDFNSSAALKVQLDSTRSYPPGYGVWNRDAALNQRSVRLNQLTATIDFIF